MRHGPLTKTNPQIHIAGSIDFDNSRRSISSSIIIPFLPSSSPEKKNAGSVQLEQGSYFVEFNETVEVPLDMMGLIYPRSSLFRSGATLVTGVVDSGFCGPLGGLLMVGNTFGLRLFEGARLGQIVMQEMSEKVEGYRGVYQGKDFELERK
jgi:dUTP pyrophosphatase